MTLCQLPKGDRGRITRVNATGALSQKLSDMGFIPGSEVRMVRSAPLKDPLEVQIVSYYVSLRCEEANFVEIEQIS